MKKVYSKPRIYVEKYSLSAHIAGELRSGSQQWNYIRGAGIWRPLWMCLDVRRHCHGVYKSGVLSRSHG